jgi:pimeloyl-ACP methyl ester carboxylesterase
MSEHDAFDVRLAGGRRLRVRRWAGRGRPLVLLHGLLDDSEGWAEVAERSKRPVLAFDLPGFGGSSLPTRPRISAYADDVTAALRWLDLHGVTLVGHSLGGAVATAVAERSPTVDALVLLAPAGFGHIRLAEAFTLPGVVTVTEAALPLTLWNPLLVTAAYTTMVAHHRLPSRDLVQRLRRRAWVSGRGTRMAVEAIAAAGRSERAFHKRTIGFEGPVFALWGERDALVPLDHADAVRRALPHARVDVWTGMGHHPQRERPEALDRYIEGAAWCARTRAARVRAARRRDGAAARAA